MIINKQLKHFFLFIHHLHVYHNQSYLCVKLLIRYEMTVDIRQITILKKSIVHECKKDHCKHEKNGFEHLELWRTQNLFSLYSLFFFNIINNIFGINTRFSKIADFRPTLTQFLPPLWFHVFKQTCAILLSYIVQCKLSDQMKTSYIINI